MPILGWSMQLDANNLLIPDATIRDYSVQLTMLDWIRITDRYFMETG